MRTMRFKKTAVILAATALVGVAGAANAAVSVGSQTTGQVPFSAYTKSGIQFVVDANAGPVAMSCGAAAAAGVIYAGTAVPGLRNAEIEGTAWSKCIGPSSIPMNVYQVANSKWRLNTTAASGNPRAGYIDQINAYVKSKTKVGGVPICAFNVTGRADASFNTTQVTGNNNYTQTLTVNQPNTTPNLTVSNIVGCFGLLTAGDAASFNGSFKVYNSVGLVAF